MNKVIFYTIVTQFIPLPVQKVGNNVFFRYDIHGAGECFNYAMRGRLAMSIDHFFAYFLILFVATITPGPSMLLALNHGVNHGIGRSIVSGTGNVIGNLLMALVSITGLGIVLATSGMVFNCIKWMGVLYLVIIGLTMVFGPDRAEKRDTSDGARRCRTSGGRLFLDGFIVAVGNPKGVLFFTALFPQFIDMRNSTAIEFLVVFVTLGAVAFGCYLLYALFGVKLNRLFHVPSFRKSFNRITGSLLVGAGAVVAFSKK